MNYIKNIKRSGVIALNIIELIGDKGIVAGGFPLHCVWEHYVPFTDFDVFAINGEYKNLVKRVLNRGLIEIKSEKSTEKSTDVSRFLYGDKTLQIINGEAIRQYASLYNDPGLNTLANFDLNCSQVGVKKTGNNMEVIYTKKFKTFCKDKDIKITRIDRSIWKTIERITKYIKRIPQSKISDDHIRNILDTYKTTCYGNKLTSFPYYVGEGNIKDITNPVE
jgi:hypothetical protein